MDLRPYRAILFDLDGTLIDYRGAQEHAAGVIAAETGLDDSPRGRKRVMDFLQSRVIQDLEACKPSAIEPGSAEMRLAFRKAGLDADPIGFIEAYFQGLSEHGHPLPGVPGLLGLLRGRFTLGVVTNGPGSVQRKRLQKAGLMEFLDLLVISCEVKHAKPDPEIIRIAMKLAGTETFSTLFVGDSAGSDMGAANAAGVDFVFVRPDQHQPATGPRVLEVQRVSDLAGSVETDGVDNGLSR